MRRSRTTSRDRLHDSSPGRNVHGADMISVVREPAAGADEFGLRPPVCLVDTPARWAHPAGVARVDGTDLYASKSGLVRNERAELEERPAVQVRSLGLANCYPTANASEIFEGDPASGVFGLANESLADRVVRVGVESVFSPRELLQMALGALRPDGLKCGLQLNILAANGQRLLPRELLPIGVDGQVANAKVHAEPTLRLDEHAIWNLDGHVEVELPVAIDEVGLPADACEARPMVVPDDARHDDASVEGQQAHAVDTLLEAHESLVEGDCAVRRERRPDRLVVLVDLADLRDGPDCVLRRQLEAGAQLVVEAVLELNFVGGLQLESVASEPVARFVDSLHESSQLVPVVFGGVQFDLGDQLHAHSMLRPMLAVKHGPALPLSPKGDSLRAGRVL